MGIAPLPINAGGALRPDQVVGRDELVARVWERLEQQSVLLTAERRMGKTSVIRAMRAAPPDGVDPGRADGSRTAESPEAFVESLVSVLLEHLPARHRVAERLRGLLTEVNVEVYGTAVSLTANDRPWTQLLLDRVLRVLDERDARVVLFMDEFPFMLRGMDAGQAREVLDTLRAGAAALRQPAVPFQRGRSACTTCLPGSMTRQSRGSPSTIWTSWRFRRSKRRRPHPSHGA